MIVPVQCSSEDFGKIRSFEKPVTLFPFASALLCVNIFFFVCGFRRRSGRSAELGKQKESMAKAISVSKPVYLALFKLRCFILLP